MGAQLCSYEIIFIFLILILINFNFNNIFNILILILWYFTCLAELNRTPFDLLEGESELVSGFNTEFRSRRFTLLFIGEYLNLWLLLRFLSIFMRAAYPRIKFNEIIELL